MNIFYLIGSEILVGIECVEMWIYSCRFLFVLFWYVDFVVFWRVCYSDNIKFVF